MTERERFEIAETKLRLLRRAGNRCEICGAPLTTSNVQLAHRIPKSRMNLDKYGKEVIHHDLNLAATCSLKCNSAAIVHWDEEQDLVRAIREELSQQELFA